MRLAVFLLALSACEGGHDHRPDAARDDVEPIFDVKPLPRSLRVRWSIQLGGTDQDTLTSVATDSSGNVYATGARGARRPGGITVLYTGFITKRDADTGAEIWAKDFEPFDDDSFGTGIVTIDPSDNVYFAGTFAGRVMLDGEVLGEGGEQKSFLVKWMADGQHAWTRPLDVGAGFVTSTAVDAAGRTFIAGTETVSAPDDDSYLLAYDSDGTHAWTKRFHASDIGPNITSVAIAANGDVCTVGTYQQATSFGGAELPAHPQMTTFVARFDRTGAHVRSRRVDPMGWTSWNPRVATIGDRVVVQQQEGGQFPFMTLRTFDPTFQERWATPIDNEGGTGPQMRALAVSGNATISSAWTDFPPTEDGWMEVSIFNGVGVPDRARFGRRFSPGARGTQVQAMVATPTGNLVFAGEFSGGLELVPMHGLVSEVQDSDLFIVVTEP